jgi:hypothetical protein
MEKVPFTFWGTQYLPYNFLIRSTQGGP